MKKKNILGVLLSVTLMLGIMSVSGAPAHAYILERFPLWINNTQVTSDNLENILGNQTASYNAGTNTLTLTNANISTGYVYNQGENSSAGIYYSGSDTLKIVLSGTSTIANSNTPLTKGIYGNSDTDIIISGSGSLTASGSYTGIEAYDLTLNSGTVETNGATGGITANRNIEITGGNITAAGNNGYGISAREIIISNGKITAIGNNGSGIETSGGDILISGGDVTAISKSNMGNGICSISDYDYNFNPPQIGGKVSISNGNVNAIGNFAGISGDSDITIEDGTVNVKGAGKDSYGITTYKDVAIVGGKITACGNAQGISGNVKNCIIGTGWSDAEGTKGRARIEINTKGQDLMNYKRVQFPVANGKVTVTFNTVGGSIVAEQVVELGGRASRPSDPTRRGCTFDGWFNGNTAFDFSTPINEDITLTAHWKEDAPPVPAPRETVRAISVAKGVAKGKTSLKFTWNKINGAATYEVWMSKSDKKPKKIKTLGAGKTTFIKKRLKKNTAYQFFVVAKSATGKNICKSNINFAYTGNGKGKFTNVKSLKVSKKSYTLKKDNTAKIKTTQTKAKKGKKLCNLAKKLRYTSDNPSVAKVDKNGMITAVGSGSCTVYVQTVNGIWKTVKVTVN